VTPVDEEEVERPCARMPNDDAEFADYYHGSAEQRLSAVSWEQWGEV